MNMNFTLIAQIVIMIKLAVHALGGANEGREVVKTENFHYDYSNSSKH